MSGRLERLIEHLLARVRDIERSEARGLNPASWIRAKQQILAKTPAGGIPAATGSGPYTWGSATCTVVTEGGVVTAKTVMVKNIVDDAIAGNVVIKASAVGSIWVVDVASCGS